VLARDEFTQAMKALGLRATEAEYNKLFDEYDIDKSGEIDLVRTCCMHMNASSHVLACCSLTSLIAYINAHCDAARLPHTRVCMFKGYASQRRSTLSLRLFALNAMRVEEPLKLCV
jgi:hypothetical protein